MVAAIVSMMMGMGSLWLVLLAHSARLQEAADPQSPAGGGKEACQSISAPLKIIIIDSARPGAANCSNVYRRYDNILKVLGEAWANLVTHKSDDPPKGRCLR